MPKSHSHLVSRKHLYTALEGYDIFEEISNPSVNPNEPTVTLKVAYDHHGNYIGDIGDADFLYKEKGILPETYNDNNVCTIGFCQKELKWYGWSHREIHGFTIGDEVKEGDYCTSSGWTKEYLKEHPEEDFTLKVGFKAESLEDAKRMAIAYANSVS